MKEPIANVKLKFACPMNWDEMGNVTGGKNCDACKRKVYDLTDCDQSYLDQLLADNNYSICGRFTKKQLAPTAKTFVWKNWISAAMVLLGSYFWSAKATAQTMPSVDSTLVKCEDLTTMLGEVVVVSAKPQFIGGEKELNKFLENNTRYQGRNGKVIVSFVVDCRGNITHPNIKRGLDNASNNEALRLVKMLPRWLPGFEGGETVSRVEVLEINFKKP